MHACVGSATCPPGVSYMSPCIKLHVAPWGQLHVPHGVSYMPAPPSLWGQLHVALSSFLDEIGCLTIKHLTMHVDAVGRLNMFNLSLAVMAGHVLAHQCIHQEQHTSESKGGETACTLRVSSITTYARLAGLLLASAP